MSFETATAGEQELTWPMAKRLDRLQLDSESRATLLKWLRAPTTPQRVALRSRIVLLIAGGMSARQAARQLGISRHTADLWQARYREGGCAALAHDRPGRGRKPRGRAR